MFIEKVIGVEKRNTFIAVILIIALGFGIYLTSINGKFLLDDASLIEQNAFIKSWNHIGKIFTTDEATGSGNRHGYYRPVFTLSLMMDYHLWKLDEKGYHIITILFHIFVALSVYWLIGILFGDRLISLFTAVFFLVHPIQTEDVAYITGRAHSMMSLFMLLSFIFYVKHYRSGRIGAYILMLLSYTMALLSKEDSVVFPVLLLLYHYIFKKRIRPVQFLPLVGFDFGYLLLRLAIIKSSLIDLGLFEGIFKRLPGFFLAIVNYAKMLLLPFNLYSCRSQKLFQFTNPYALAGICILASLIIYAFRKRSSNRLISFSIFWFFLMLLPVSNIYPTSNYMAMRYLYLPSLGFFLVLAYGLAYWYRIKKSRGFAASSIISLIIFYSYLTIKLIPYWKDPITFYTRTLNYVPDNAVVYNNLGAAYESANRKEETIALYKKAIELDPARADPYNNLGVVYERANRKQEAIALYKKAIEVDPARADAYSNLGNIYSAMNKIEEAIAAYKKAIEINPEFAETYCSLGNAYKEINKIEEAIAAYKKAIEINPNLALAYSNLSIVYFQKQQYQLAIEYCDRAEELGFVNGALLEALKPYRE